MVEAGFDPEPVERAADERHLGAQPGQPKIAEWLQPDLVEHTGEVIRAGARAELAEALGEGDRELVLGTKRPDRVPHLLNLGQTQRIVAEPDIEALDARIVGAALQ